MMLDFDRSLEKQPSEELTIRLELANLYSSLVISGYALVSAEAKVFDSKGTDVTSSMVFGTPSIDATNKYVFVTVIDGAAGKDYFLRLQTTWAKEGHPNQKPECDLLIQVREKGF